MSIDLKRMQEAIRLCMEEMSRCYPDGTVIVAEPFHMAYIAGRDSMREELAAAERKLAEIEEEADDGVRYHQSRGVSTLHLERILTIVRGEK